MPDGTAPDQAPLDAALRAVLGTVAGALSATEAALLAELEGLGRTVARAKADVARLQVADIAGSHIPSATDELDAIVAHTAQATNEILDCCETLEQVAPRLGTGDAATLNAALTRIYEACSFQDITGQRIGKVVSALKAIEARVAAVTGDFRDAQAATAGTEGERLATGPQLPGAGATQADIDRLLDGD